MAAERAADPVINKETLLEACEAFLADKSKPTQEAYTRYIKRIFLPFMEKKDFLFSTLNVKEFRVFIRENHTKSVASVCAACIKSFLKFLQAEGYLPRPQHENIKSIKVYRENDRSDLSKEEMKACLDECRTYQETMMIKLALSSALRVSSLVKLHADDFKADGRNPDVYIITVKAAKGDKDGTVRIKKFYELDRAIQRGGFLFKSRKRAADGSVTHMKEPNFRRIMKGVFSRINRGDVTPHFMRKLCARLLQAEGKTISQIQHHLMHSQSKTTDLYLNPRMEKVAVDMDFFDVVAEADAAVVKEEDDAEVLMEFMDTDSEDDGIIDLTR